MDIICPAPLPRKEFIGNMKRAAIFLLVFSLLAGLTLTAEAASSYTLPDALKNVPRKAEELSIPGELPPYVQITLWKVEENGAIRIESVGDGKWTFTPKYTMGPRKGQEITTFDGSDPPLVQCWPADQLLERSYAQKCFGVCPPWVESRLNAYLETLENAGGDPEASLPSLTDTAAHSDFVLAIIDFDADGKVTLPENVAAASGLTPEQRVLPMTAAAWTWTDPKKGRVRILTSW